MTFTGPLGAGKTTLIKELLKQCGVRDTVTSPTFTYLNQYENAQGETFYHFDLYRLADPEELEFLGIRDYLSADAILFVEWPERGAGMLPKADAHIRIHYVGAGRNVVIEVGEGGRNQWINSVNG